MFKMKLILIFVLLVGLVGCKSNKTSNVNSTNTKESAELVALEKVENSNKTLDDITEPLKVAELEAVKNESSASIFGIWRVISILKSKKIIDLPYEKWDMQLTFEEESGNVGIKSPCNSGGCNYELKGSEISVGGNCFFTEMYCEDELKNEWEKKLVEVLADQTEVISLNEITLKLNGSTFSVELSRI